MKNISSNLKFRVRKHDMPCALERHISEHVNIIKVFHDANSILYTVTDIYLKAEILLEAINVFRSEKLALFTLTSIYSIRCNIDSQMKHS